MGYTKDGSITNFWPDDTSDVSYFASSMTLGDILAHAKEKWPDVEPDMLNIEAEHIHTHCIYYDLHDAGDYTTFIVVRPK